MHRLFPGILSFAAMRRAKTRYLTIGGLLLIFVAVIAIFALTSTPESPAGDSPTVLGDYERVTLQVQGMT